MPRIFLDISDEKHQLITGENAHYILRVLRLGPGDELELINGKGGCVRAQIASTGKNELRVDITDQITLTTESPLRIGLFQGMLKGAKMDLVVQKATELGVSSINPMITERSIRRVTRSVERWRKIAIEASRQSGRSVVPVINAPVSFQKACMGKMSGVFFWEESRNSLSATMREFSRTPSDISVFVGPEGGFSKAEAAEAMACGLIEASLGPRVLRAETAAIAALGIIQFTFGDVGK